MINRKKIHNNYLKVHDSDPEDDIASFTLAYCLQDKDLEMIDILNKGFNFNNEHWEEDSRQQCIIYLKEKAKYDTVGRNCCGGDVILKYLQNKHPVDFNI